MLVRQEIIQAIEVGNIKIDPYERKKVNPNSYNVTLGRNLVEYSSGVILDPKDPVEPSPTPMLQEGVPGFERWVLYPGYLYLASTVERTESDFYIPMINGRSSLARLGISVHQTGGFGDIGFKGHWTLEITVAVTTYLYPGMEIAQICWFPPTGVPAEEDLYSGKYVDQESGPVASRIAGELAVKA